MEASPKSTIRLADLGLLSRSHAEMFSTRGTPFPTKSFANFANLLFLLFRPLSSEAVLEMASFKQSIIVCIVVGATLFAMCGVDGTLSKSDRKDKKAKKKNNVVRT